MARTKAPAVAVDPTTPLPALLPPEVIRDRLAVLFPESFPDRGILVGQLASRVVFVFLYGGFIEDSERYLRPAHVYLFTEEQATKISDVERLEWVAASKKFGFRPVGQRWYADTSKETIRDDLMRNQFLRLGIMKKHQPHGYSSTSSTPVNFLATDFAALFDPKLKEKAFLKEAESWRAKHLDKGTLQRMALRVQGIQAKKSDIFVDMPDGTRIRLSSGPSNEIVKAIIEEFAPKRLKEPAVLWVSASDKKSYPQFVDIAKSVGLQFDLNAELPDLILADMVDPVKFYMCEVVATDGPVTEMRKQALLDLVKASSVPEDCVAFLTAFKDREAPPFRKNFSRIALNTLIWFRTEPDLLVLLDVSGITRMKTSEKP